MAADAAVPDDQPVVPGGLTPSQLRTFEQDGYLLIPGALTPSTVASLLAESQRLLSSFDLDSHPKTRFTTGGADGTDHVGDDYFLSSGDKVRFFFEEDAFDRVTGELVRPKEEAVNKIGHALHMHSPPFAALLRKETGSDGHEAVQTVSPAAIARSLGFRDPRCLQSMVICKQPGIGGAVPPHQDSTFLYTRPPSCVGFWYALEDCDSGNGCLSFLPGSHKWAPVTSRMVRKAGDTGTEFVTNDGPRFPDDGREYGERADGSNGANGQEEAYVMGEVKAGTLVLIHGNLLHKSERNLSNRSRFIYTFHIIESADGVEYDSRNWLQPPAEGFTRLYD